MADYDLIDLTSDDSDFELLDELYDEARDSQLSKPPISIRNNVKATSPRYPTQGPKQNATPVSQPSWKSYFLGCTDQDPPTTSSSVSEQLTQPSGSQDRPIEVDEDDYDEATRLQALYPIARQPLLHGAANPLAVLANVQDMSDEEEEIVLEEAAAEVIVDETRLSGLLDADGYMTDEDINRLFPIATAVTAGTNSHFQPRGLTALVLQPDCAVELNDGTFLFIKQVSRRLGRTFIGGIHLERPKRDDLIIPQRRNEVTWIEALEGEEFLAGAPAKLVYRDTQDAIRNREIVFTNRSWPSMSMKDDAAAHYQSVRDRIAVPLFCRWKRVIVKESLQHTQEQAVVRLSEAEADNGSRVNVSGQRATCRISNAEARNEWRGVLTQLGGSHNEVRKVHCIDGSSEVIRQLIQRYTFGDSFCGAGGCSCGARDAGCKIEWGFDMDSQAIKSYSHNFAADGTQCREEAVHTFIEVAMRGGFIVDILHISPPCQPFSAAHTVPNPERDEKNQAALFSVWQLLEAVRPRVVTIEETEGLLTRHVTWFSALIHIFLNHGYSVRWKIVKCEHFGVPQTRKRLLIIASGPGEKLPPFPRPTHAAGNPLLKKLVTIGDVIRNIPFNNALHQIVGSFKEGPRTPFSFANLAKTLTCNGGQYNYHPSGTRPYTMRETACLQTFPLRHSFKGAQGLITATRKQIGNAVPPLLAKVLYLSVIKSLKESDTAEGAAAAAHQARAV